MTQPNSDPTKHNADQIREKLKALPDGTLVCGQPLDLSNPDHCLILAWELSKEAERNRIKQGLDAMSVILGGPR